MPEQRIQKAGAPRPAVAAKETKAAARSAGETRAQLRLFTDTLVDAINGAIEASRNRHDGIADLLLREVFHNNPAEALQADKTGNARYREISGRAGATLDLDRTELSLHVRIGALNEALKGEAWTALRWSKKVALLPLLGLLEKPTARKVPGRQALQLPAVETTAFKLIRKGVAYALRPKVGVRLVRDWVAGEVEAAPVAGAKQSARLLRSGRSLVQGGVRLNDPQAREALAKGVRTARPETREAFKSDLRATIANLGKLLEEIDDE